MSQATTVRRVLIVDDDLATGIDLGSRLSGLGYEVVGIAGTGREALALAERLKPHVILIDAALGGDIDGLETASAIRQRETLPILFTVDETDDVVRRTVQKSTHGGYLLKPFADRDLRIGLETALEKRDANSGADMVEHRFFDTSIDLLCCLGFNGHFARLNPAWERALGFTREELMSRPFIEFVHPDDRERTLNQNRAVRNGGQAYLFENRYLCKDGSYRWFLWNASPDVSRETIYSVARDITEAKRAEAERELLVHQLETALAEVKSLRAILPACAYCKKVRDEGDWMTIEDYISLHTNSRFSHGICPTCFEEQMGKLDVDRADLYPPPV